MKRYLPLALFLLLLIFLTGIFFVLKNNFPKVKKEVVTEIGNSCTRDDDCKVFGKSGDCNCGCFNKNYQWKAEGKCYCAAPSSCKCINSLCQGVFSE